MTFPFARRGEFRSPIDETRGLFWISGDAFGASRRERNHRLHFRTEMPFESDSGARKGKEVGRKGRGKKGEKDRKERSRKKRKERRMGR